MYERMIPLFLLSVFRHTASHQYDLTAAAFVPQTDGYNETLVSNITNLLNNILNKYDRNFPPRHATGGPVVVSVDISVRSMGPISEKDMEFSMDCYFRQRWADDRLKHPIPLNDKVLSLNANFLRDIWRPDTYVRNGQRSYLHMLTVPNIQLRIHEDGIVSVSQRLTIKTRCPMFLKKFPMDVQACLVELGSMAYSVSDVVYRWKKTPDISGDVELSQYTLQGIVATERIVPSYRDPEENVSTLIVYFKLQRQTGFYILQIYTPCILTVVMSWVSFWINKEASPARVALGVMTVLTMSTMSLGGRNELPRVSYSTALDIYAVGCFGFVFFALVEYAVINFAHFFHLSNVVSRMHKAKMTSKDSSAPASSMTTAFVVEGPETTTKSGPIEEAVSAGPPGFSTTELLDTDVQTSPTRAYMLKRRISSADPKNVLNNFSSWLSRRRRSSKVVDPASDAANNNTTRKQNGVLSAFLDDTDEDEDGGKMAVTCFPIKKRRKRGTERNLDTEMDWIDDVAKVLFPAAYLIFNGIYWMTFYWLDDEIDSIPAIRDTSLHIASAALESGFVNATANSSLNGVVNGTI